MSDVPELLGGRYEVGDLLGRGGMAEVHLGFDTRLGRPVAIKMLRSDLARDATFLSRFRREAQSAAALNHASVVAVYDHGEDHVHTESGGAKVNIPYIVMEYVDGKTLRQILTERGQFEPNEAVRITEGVLDALGYSHRQGIVHRDIKPANVMIGDDGAVKVMDFGIARALADANATVTATQAVIGTAQYLSPEQAQGHSVDARSDLYSAGCMLFELLTGRPPFLGDSPVAIAYQHVGEAPVPPSRYAEAVSDDLDAVVLHSLEKDREERYQEASEFRADLQAVRLGRPISVAARSSAAAVAGAALAGATEALPSTAHVSDGTAAYGVPVSTQTPPPPDDDEPLTRRERLEEDDRGPGAARWVLLAIAVLAALGLLGYGLISYFGQDPVKTTQVPTVVDAPEDAATATLTTAGFRVQSVVAASDTVDQGLVISQDPAGGTRAETGSTVRITVSGGPDNVEVPDLAGQLALRRQAAAQGPRPDARHGEVGRRPRRPEGRGDLQRPPERRGRQAGDAGRPPGRVGEGRGAQRQGADPRPGRPRPAEGRAHLREEDQGGRLRHPRHGHRPGPGQHEDGRHRQLDHADGRHGADADGDDDGVTVTDPDGLAHARRAAARRSPPPSP